MTAAEIASALITVLGVLIAAVVVVRRLNKPEPPAEVLLKTLRRQRPRPLLARRPYGGHCQFVAIGTETTRDGWQSFVIAVTPEAVTLYPESEAMDRQFAFAPDALRWFGRPKKYREYQNDLWMHVETYGRWFVVKLKLNYDDAQRLVRALKAIAPPPLVTAYRRQRPYIHYGPMSAVDAAQDIYGAWTLTTPRSVYLMPTYLVLLHGERVERKIPVETITHVRAVTRLDAPGGVVTFRAGDSTLAFAVNAHEAFAAALAEAAKRSLEAPLEVLSRKQKQKKAE